MPENSRANGFDLVLDHERACPEAPFDGLFVDVSAGILDRPSLDASALPVLSRTNVSSGRVRGSSVVGPGQSLCLCEIAATVRDPVHSHRGIHLSDGALNGKVDP